MNKSSHSANASFMSKFLKRMFNPEGKPELTLEYLIGIDAVQWAGFDAENNVPLYVFTEKIKEISPALYQERQTEVYKLTLDLWEKGFVEADWLTEVEYHACPSLKPGAGPISKESSFVGLEWDSESELFEGSTAGYEIQTVSGDTILGWDYNYCLLISFISQTSANSLEEAIDKVKSEVLDSLLIYDGGMDETFEVKDVRLALKTN